MSPDQMLDSIYNIACNGKCSLHISSVDDVIYPWANFTTRYAGIIFN